MKTLGSGVAWVCAILLLGVGTAPAQEVAPPIPTHPDARVAERPAAAAAAELDPFAWLRRPESPEATRWAATEAEQAQRWLNADKSYAPLLKQAAALQGADGSVLLAGGRLYLDGPGGWTSRAVRTDPTAGAGWRREPALDRSSPSSASDEVKVLCEPRDRGACLLLRRTGHVAELSGYDPASGALQPSPFAAPPGLQDVAFEAGGGLLAVSDEAGGSVVRRLAPARPAASSAAPVYRGAPGDVVTPGAGVGRGGEPVAWLTVRRPDGGATLLIDAQGAFRRLAAPAGSEIVGVVGDQLVVQLREGWAGVDSLPAGSLLGFDLKPLLTRAPELSPHPILKLADTPDIRQAVATRAGLLLVAREGGEEVAYLCDPTLRGWAVRRLSATAADGLEVAAVDPATDAAVLRTRAFPEGDRLRGVDTRDGAVTPDLPRRQAFADSPRQALTAQALDRTQVGYTLIRGSDEAGGAAHPVLLTAAPRGPRETAVLQGVGALWLARGGDLAVAGRRARRYDPRDGLAEVLTGYEDLSSIARDLVARGLASPGRISLAGYRSGASLAAVDLVKHPGQWAAAALIDPVADPLGASGESDEPWAQTFDSAREGAKRSAWRRVAPYDNLRQGVRYAPLLTVQTPQAAEVFASDGARLTARLNAVGGDSLHVAARDDAQACALTVAFLTRVLGLGAKT